MFAPLCYPPAGSEAIVAAKLVLAALDAGWEMDVISQADFGHYYPTSSGGVWEPVTKVVHNISGMKKGGHIGGVSRSPMRRSLGSLQSISWSVKATLTALRLLSKKKYDFILSRATPQYGHLPALMLSRRVRTPWIANWSDPLPPQKAPPPYGGGPSARVPLHLRIYCSAVARNPTWHTFPCERLRNYFSSYLPDCASKSSVIPHIALERFRTRISNPRSKFSLCHAGGLTLRNPSVFLEGLRNFLDKTKVDGLFKIRFVGLPLDNVRELSRTLGLDQFVSTHEMMAYEETQRIAANSSVLVVLEAISQEGVFFPSKFVDFVQTGRPILAVSPVVGTLADILSTSGGGLPADGRSPDSVANAIGILYDEWRMGTLDEKYGSSKLFDLFGERRIIDLYLEIFRRIAR